MIRTLIFYLRIMTKVIRKQTVNNEDYSYEYNKIAKTYSLWLEKMGQYTDKIIKPDYILKEKGSYILDFACGTGYITKSLLDKERIDQRFHITAVDISEEMLRQLKKQYESKVKIVHADGIKHLNNTSEKYDAIYCGWALPYFNNKLLLKSFKEHLNTEGILAIIANTQGTLNRIEEIFLTVMKNNQSQVVKPMDIRFHLFKDKIQLKRFFMKFGFCSLELDEANVEFSFDTPEQLHEWIIKTGALAGSGEIFINYDEIKKEVISEIKKETFKDGKYIINHKFVYGIFRSY